MYSELNAKPNNNGSFEAIDAAKFILAFFVVAIHTHPLENCGISLINNVYNFVVICAVPIFFMSSGYLLMNKIVSTSSGGADTTNDVLKKYLKKITFLYVIWTAIYLPVTIYHYVAEKFTCKESVIDFVKGFVFVGEHYNSWILWYLLATIYAILFVLALRKLHFNIKTICIAGFVVFVLSCLINAFVGYSGALPESALIVRKIISHTFVNGRVFRGFLYVPLGMMFNTKAVNTRAAALLTAFGFALGIAGEYTFEIVSEIAVAFFAAGVFLLLINVRLKPSNSYFKLRKMSTVIYFIHLYIYSAFEIFVWNGKQFGFIPFVAVSAISLIISFDYVQIRYKNKKS